MGRRREREDGDGDERATTRFNLISTKTASSHSDLTQPTTNSFFYSFSFLSLVGYASSAYLSVVEQRSLDVRLQGSSLPGGRSSLGHLPFPQSKDRSIQYVLVVFSPLFIYRSMLIDLSLSLSSLRRWSNSSSPVHPRHSPDRVLVRSVQRPSQHLVPSRLPKESTARIRRSNERDDG